MLGFLSLSCSVSLSSGCVRIDVLYTDISVRTFIQIHFKRWIGKSECAIAFYGVQADPKQVNSALFSLQSATLSYHPQI